MGTICVKYPNHADIHLVLPVIIKKQGFCTTFPLIIAGTKTNRINISTVRFRLWMNFRISVHFGCRCLQNSCSHSLCQSQTVNCPHNRGLNCLDRIILIVNGRCRTGKVVDPVDFHLEWIHHIMSQHFKIFII